MKKVRGFPYLYRRGETYYFRKRLPANGLDNIFREEYRVSLQTKDLGIAKKRCMIASLIFSNLDQCIRMAPAERQEAVMNAVFQYFQKYLERCRELAPMILDGDPHILGQELESWKLRHHDLLRSKATGEKGPQSDPGVIRSLQEEGVDISANDSTLFYADLEISRIMVAMYSQNFEDAVPRSPFQNRQAETFIVSDPKGLGQETLGEITKRYVALKSKNSWGAKTIGDQTRVMNWLCEHGGRQTAIEHLDKPTMRSFRDGLLDLPKNANKHNELNSLDFRALGKVNDSWPRISGRTAKKYYEMATSFLEWCVDEGYLNSNPSARLRLKHSFNPQEARFPFCPEQLKALFNSPLYLGCKSSRFRGVMGETILRDDTYWIPLIGLYTGMRLGEIIDLGSGDVQEVDGVTIFSIGGTEGEKKLKTVNAKRIIPLHKDLVRLGFIDFLDQAKKYEKAQRVFGNIEISKTGYASHNYSKWFSRYLKRTGAKSDKTSFHSFRHNFKDGMRAAGIPDGVQNQLMGHSDNGVATTYGSGWPIKVLEAEINKINFSAYTEHLFVGDLEQGGQDV